MDDWNEQGRQLQEPPRFLFHGTAYQMMGAINREGLRKMARQYVHLSGDLYEARLAGRRAGLLVLLQVDAEQMHQDGFEFQKSDNGTWLVDAVPPKYLKEIQP